jgi:hypothetical protein
MKGKPTMAIRLRNLSKTQEFISELDSAEGETIAEKKKNGATVFHVRPLNSSELSHLNDRMASVQIEQEGETMNRAQRRAARKAGKQKAQSQTTRMNIFEVALECVRGSVTQIDNLEDENGKPVKFDLVKGKFAGASRDILPDSIMDAFDPEVALEIFEFVMENDQVSEEDAKNS